jgi:hypothetical protein
MSKEERVIKLDILEENSNRNTLSRLGVFAIYDIVVRMMRNEEYQKI